MKRILHIVCLLSLFIVSGCSKSSSGTYEGTCENQTYGGSAQMGLILNENKEILTGTLTLSGNLGGGADIQGRKDGTSIAFVTRSAYGQISWSGTIKGDSISGHYMTESSPEYMAQTGLTESQRGIWSVTKK